MKWNEMKFRFGDGRGGTAIKNLNKPEGDI